MLWLTSGDNKMTLDKIKEALKDRNLTVIAGKTGIPYQALARLRRDDSYQPKHDIVVKLIEYFEGAR